MSNATKHQSGEFCWNELITPASERAQAFYTALFGWTLKHHEMGNHMTYMAFMRDDTSLAGIVQMPTDKQVSPHWMSYINVENLDTSVEKAKSLGAHVIKSKTLLGDKGCFAIIQDPAGAHVAIWEWFV